MKTLIKEHIVFTLICTIFLCIFSLFAGCSQQNDNSNSSVNIDQTNLPTESKENSVNVEFNGEHVWCNQLANSYKKNSQIDLSLDFEYDRDKNTNWKHIPDPDNPNSEHPEGELSKPIIEYELLIDNIHVYIDNTEYPDAFTWMYQKNDKNKLTIKKEYVKNNIKIVAKGTPRTATLTLYGMDLEDSEFDNYKAGTLKFNFKTKYQNEGMQKIRTISNGLAFPVFEDDDIDVTISTDDPNVLPKNLWFRTNARWCIENEEFTIEYAQDGKSVHITVPHYVVTDHCSIKKKV